MKNLMRWTILLCSLPRTLILGALNLLLSQPPRNTVFNGHIVPCREGGWVGLVSAGVGLVGGIMSQNKANGAESASGRLATDQANDSERDKRLSGDLYSQYDQIGLPAEQRYIAAAEKPVNADAAANAAVGAIDEQATGARASMARTDASYGINPNSGRAISENANFNLNTAVAKAGAATAARRQAVQQTLSNLGSAAGAGGNLLSGAETFAGMEPAGLSGASANEAAIAGQQGQTAAGYGNLAGYGLSSYMNNNPSAPPPSTPTYANTGTFSYSQPTPSYQLSP